MVRINCLFGQAAFQRRSRVNCCRSKMEDRIWRDISRGEKQLEPKATFLSPLLLRAFRKKISFLLEGRSPSSNRAEAFILFDKLSAPFSSLIERCCDLFSVASSMAPGASSEAISNKIDTWAVFPKLESLEVLTWTNLFLLSEIWTPPRSISSC